MQWHYNFLFCKVNYNRLSWSSDVDLNISAEGVNFVFWPSQREPRLSSAQRTLHLLEVKYAIK